MSKVFARVNATVRFARVNATILELGVAFSFSIEEKNKFKIKGSFILT